MAGIIWPRASHNFKVHNILYILQNALMKRDRCTDLVSTNKPPTSVQHCNEKMSNVQCPMTQIVLPIPMDPISLVKYTAMRAIIKGWPATDTKSSSSFHFFELSYFKIFVQNKLKFPWSLKLWNCKNALKSFHRKNRFEFAHF